MIHFLNQKNKTGFSLIEAIVALLIVGIMIGSLFKLQTTLFRNTFFAQSLISKFIKIKNVFVQSDQEKWFTKEKNKIIKDDSGITLNYTIKNLPENSPLKNLKNLYIEKVEAEWFVGTKKRTDSLISLRFTEEKL